MIPALAVQQNGLGVVNNDNMNTWVQGGCLLANLQQFTGLSGMTVILIGLVAPGDGGQGTFYWNATWQGAPDNSNSIQPFGVIVGAWLRLPGVAGANGLLRVAQSVTADAMVAGDGLIIWNQQGTGPRAETLLAASSVPNDYRVTVKDGFGDSAIYPITSTPISGTVDGGASGVINVRKGSLTFAANSAANDWIVI